MQHPKHSNRIPRVQNTSAHPDAVNRVPKLMTSSILSGIAHNQNSRRRTSITLTSFHIQIHEQKPTQKTRTQKSFSWTLTLNAGAHIYRADFVKTAGERERVAQSIAVEKDLERVGSLPDWLSKTGNICVSICLTASTIEKKLREYAENMLWDNPENIQRCGCWWSCPFWESGRAKRAFWDNQTGEQLFVLVFPPLPSSEQLAWVWIPLQFIPFPIRIFTRPYRCSIAASKG